MIKISSVYQSNNYGPFVVLHKEKSSDYYRIRFLNTGTEKTVRGHQIKTGCVRDQFAKSICGVGWTGNAKTKGNNKCLYSIWHDMINRCYNSKDKRHHSYTTVTVDDRWLKFDAFIKDVQEIDGYDLPKIMNGELVLDKDIKQRFQEHKVYSLATCLWVPKGINSSIQDSQQKPFIGISPDGTKYYSDNITQFAREHNLSRRHISSVLHGRIKTTAGWHFEYNYEDIV